jgi:hypothetical protein
MCIAPMIIFSSYIAFALPSNKRLIIQTLITTLQLSYRLSKTITKLQVNILSLLVRRMMGYTRHLVKCLLVISPNMS